MDKRSKKQLNLSVRILFLLSQNFCYAIVSICVIQPITNIISPNFTTLSIYENCPQRASAIFSCLTIKLNLVNWMFDSLLSVFVK